jgi:hypothetical protein
MKKLLLIFSISFTSMLFSQVATEINGINWCTENLSVGLFNNGDPIQEARSDKEWEEACKNKIPAFMTVDNAQGKKEKIYNYYVLLDQRGILPEGTRYPNGSEFLLMNDYFSMNPEHIQKMNLVLTETIYMESCGGMRKEKGNGFWYVDLENMPQEAIMEMNVGPAFGLSACPEEEGNFPLCSGLFSGFNSLASIGMAELGNGMLIRLIKK